jgi:hypothetical protein
MTFRGPGAEGGDSNLYGFPTIQSDGEIFGMGKRLVNITS